MIMEFLSWRVFVTILTHAILWTKPLGNGDVGVVIFESLAHSDVHPTQRFLLHRWPLRNIMLEGVSLLDHE